MMLNVVKERGRPKIMCKKLSLKIPQYQYKTRTTHNESKWPVYCISNISVYSEIYFIVTHDIRSGSCEELFYSSWRSILIM